MKKKVIIIAASVILAAIITLSIIKKNTARLPEVQTAVVETADFLREVTANGEISSKHHKQLFSAVTAAVEQVYFEEGDHILAEEILLSLDRESLENNLVISENTLANARMSVRGELLSLRSSYSSALTGRDQAKRDYERSSELHKIGSISDEAFRMAEEKLFVAEQALDSARQRVNFREGRPLADMRENFFRSDEAIVNDSPEVRKATIDYQNISENLKYYRIKAEIDGTITTLAVEDSSVVEPGSVFAVIHDLNLLVVKALVDEVDLSYIRTGQDVTVTSDSFIGSEIKGRVSRIAPIIKNIDNTRVCEVEVELLENPDNIARIGASASIFITVEKKDNAVSIPIDAFFMDKGQSYAALLVAEYEGSDVYKVEKREVTTGILDIETVEIISGLNSGDIIISGADAANYLDMEVKQAAPEKKDGV